MHDKNTQADAVSHNPDHKARKAAMQERARMAIEGRRSAVGYDRTGDGAQSVSRPVSAQKNGKPETAQDELKEKRRQQSAKRVQALLQAAEDKQTAKAIRKTKEDQQAPAMASALQELVVQDQAGGFVSKKQLVLQAKQKYPTKGSRNLWRDLGTKHYGHRIKTGIELVMWARVHGDRHHHHRLIERTEIVLVAQRELQKKA